MTASQPRSAVNFDLLSRLLNLFTRAQVVTRRVLDARFSCCKCLLLILDVFGYPIEVGCLLKMCGMMGPLAGYGLAPARTLQL